MPFYLRQVPNLYGTYSQLWKIENDSATLLGIENAETGGFSHFKSEPDEDIFDVIRRETPWAEPNGELPFLLMEIQPGQYYPRMARPVGVEDSSAPCVCPGSDNDTHRIAMAIGQLSTLTRHLDRICQIVHPSERTFGIFGHEIRNLLILACTEVESHWRGILVANGGTARTYNTKNYFAIKEAMRLDEYSVRYPNYPWIDECSPFRGWVKEKSSQSLAWYDAYNAVKHNRENEFDRATLRCAFDALTACAILIVAQFGRELDNWSRSEVRSFFQFSRLPTWPPTQVYFPIYGRDGVWEPVSFSFA